jgi:putative membrane protein
VIIEIVIALFLGLVAGTISGLIPGIHINLVAAFLLASSAFLLNFVNPLSLVVFIVSMSITHTFLDFIPSIYLGSPNEDTSLSVMPGHKFLLEGKGHEALTYTILGCLYASIFSILLTPLFILILPKIYPFINRMMAFILILGVIFLFSKEKSRVWAFVVFILAGFLGIASLNLNLSQPLLPLLSGLFGSSTIIYSITQKTQVPLQKIEKFKIEKKKLLRPLITTSIFSPLCSFLPGLGSSQAAVLSSELSGKNQISREQFLFLVGSVSIMILILSFPTLYSIQKSRTGAAATISEIMSLNFQELIIILATALISSIVSFFLAIKLSKLFSRNISKINYTHISYFVLALLFIFVTIFSGFLGLIIFFVSTSLGLLAIYTQIRKSNLMACLLVPTILLYLPAF